MTNIFSKIYIGYFFDILTSEQQKFNPCGTK